MIPMKTANGKPNNGMIIYDMLRYGKHIDHNQERIPSTTKVEEHCQEKRKKVEERKMRIKHTSMPIEIFLSIKLL